MKTVKAECEIRKIEIANYINFIDKLEDDEFFQKHKNEDKIDSTSIRTSIKASTILMLYNLVESILTKSLIKLHEVIISKNLKYEDINEAIKSMILIYYHSVMDKTENIHNSIDHIKKLVSFVRGNSAMMLSYNELSKFYTLYSGNLDSKEIISVLQKYGIKFDERASELKTIKDLRNKLAHGEASFEECGRALTIQQISAMKERTFNYIDNMIMSVEEFINQEHYFSIKKLEDTWNNKNYSKRKRIRGRHKKH
ncbi:MAG: MAE_28990/MAE_18760 family HEPN-like nuclease [Sporomusaceae bacterium]|nr:MAE_28990/MAE_18760 family HEPN-like nuclease [Sporomusaceae bacterium]